MPEGEFEMDLEIGTGKTTIYFLPFNIIKCRFFLSGEIWKYLF